jgi:PleD family two-component response regulator
VASGHRDEPSGSERARYSGSQFACILPETDPMGATTDAQELAHAVGRKTLAHASCAMTEMETIDTGLASWARGAVGGAAALMGQAAAQLCEGQGSGRFSTSSEIDAASPQDSELNRS